MKKMGFNGLLYNSLIDAEVLLINEIANCKTTSKVVFPLPPVFPDKAGSMMFYHFGFCRYGFQFF